MARTKLKKKVYHSEYFDYSPNDGIDRTEEIVRFLFCPDELQQIASSVIAILTDEPKSLRAIAEEANLLGKQLPLLYILREMTKKKAIRINDGWFQGR